MLKIHRRVIPLSQGQYALIDEQDHALVKGYHWFAVYVRFKWYAATCVRSKADGKWRQLRMHTVIMGAHGIDHRDGNGLNNSRSNLRIATQAQNCKNRSKTRAASSSPYKGVSWHKRIGKWQAYIMVNYQRQHLGSFDNPIEAAKAYDAAARAANGEFAKVNFPK